MRPAVTLFVIAAAAFDAGAAPPSKLWDEVAQPYRRRCAQLLDDATRLRNAGETRSSLSTLRKAAELCPSDREVVQSVGEALLAAHQLTDGRLHLERARLLAGDAAAPHERELALAFHLGFAREVTGDLDGAIEEHRRLEAMGGLPPPNQYLVHYNLGDELMAVGRLSEAIDEYRHAVTLAPDKPVPRMALAVALDRDGQIDRARDELAVAVTLDPDGQRLASDEYIFVPAADVHYYRALGRLTRGATAEARVELRAFIAELPAGPYTLHARARLAEAETRVDPRELEASGGVDPRVVARALGPWLASLEDCLPAPRVFPVRLSLAATGLRAEPQHPAAPCLDRVLSRVDASALHAFAGGVVTLPLAGRRGAADAP